MKKLKLLLTLIAVSIGSWQASWAQGTETSPIVVNLLEPGSLGTEVLYHVDHVKDVKYLKVTGKMNEDDWTTLSLMDSIIVMDLGDAIATIISNDKFNGKCSYLQKLILPQGLTEIGNNAFYETKLTDITFPSTLKRIGYQAFYYARNLKQIILHDGVNEIGYSAFETCDKLKTVQLPKNIKSLPSRCFWGCDNLESCPLPDGLEVINYAAFLGCDKLNTRIPQTIKKIGSNAFEYCAIDSVFLPEGVSLEATNDYGGAFNRSKIKYIEFPTSFYYAQYTPIRGCTNLKTVVLKSPTVVGLYQEFFQDINNSDIVIKVPDFVVPSYKLDSYWYNYNIEGFSTEEIDYWRIYQPLTLNNYRLEGTPSVNIKNTGSLKINGDKAMTLNGFTTEIDGTSTNRAQVISNCENISILNQFKYVYKTSSKKWFFITLPFDVKVGDIVCKSGSMAIRYYDGARRAQNGTGSNWKNYSSDDIISAGTGFIIQTSADTTVEFYAQDNESKNYVFSNKEFVKGLAVNSSATSANRGWNLVGNPWLSYYNIHKMNFTAPITVWNGSNYVAYSIIDDDYAIEPSQAFFVQCPDEINSISFPIDGRQMTSVIESQNAVRRRNIQSDRKLVDVEISDGEMSDRTRFVLNEHASVNYETNCDASKFFSMSAEVPQVYTVYEGVEYAINERPMAEGVLTLGVKIPADGTYTIKAIRNQVGDVILLDKETGVQTLLNNGEYTFSANAGQTEDRFEIRFSGIIADSINKVAGEQTNETDYFNLNGQRVLNPTKGVYVVKGKKVIIK